MKARIIVLLSAAQLAALTVVADKNVAYIHGDIAADGTLPSGAEDAYDQMLLTDSGNKGCSQFKTMVEAEGYTISQHYDQTTTLNETFLNPFDVVVFGLHQKVWSYAEKAALDDWLRHGGGILMYSDSAAGGHFGTVGIKNAVGQTAVNNIISQYGMEVTVDQGQGTRAYRPAPDSPNPIIWDRPVFEGEGISPVAIDPTGDATALIPLNEDHKVSGNSFSIDARNVTINNPVWAVIGHVAVDNGNVIVIFDRQPMWNNGPGSDINEEDNKEVLRRIVRFLARDYGNSSAWIDLNADGLELTYRQWSGGTGTSGYNYTARNTRFALEQTTNLLSDTWDIHSNWVESISTLTESAETEIATVRMTPTPANPARFARLTVHPATPTPTSGPTNTYYAINCGSTNALTGTDGTVYEADSFYDGGWTDTFPGNAVADTDDDLLYNYARSGHQSYNLPVSNGTYTVMLKFAETFFTANGKRVFDVTIEENLILDDLDLHAAAPGKWVAYDRSFTTPVSDGMLNIEFAASANNPLVNAIIVTEHE